MRTAPTGRTALSYSRGQPGAVLTDPDLVAGRAVRMVLAGTVQAIDGTQVRLDARSLCIHGDTAGAVALARAVRGGTRAGRRHPRPVRMNRARPAGDAGLLIETDEPPATLASAITQAGSLA